jgi:DNA repair photolyase
MLFDLGTPRPTTRDVARTVKAGGVEALTDAERRADAARYQEIQCRSALNPVKGMPFSWTLNPYRGCTHACEYCFARRYQTQLELGSGDEFSTLIFVKVNFVEVLRRELDHPRWSRELAALGTATDPYQPIEGHYRVTRRTLEALAAARTPVGLLTKGPMIVRDIDVLQEVIAAAPESSVCISVPTVDEDAWRALEPGTAHPMQRLRAIRALVDAGIDAGVLISPLVPGFTADPANIERTIKAVADHGARFVGANVLFLDGGTREHFLAFLAREFPALLDEYDTLYAGKYASRPYVDAVKKTVAILKARYGLSERTRRGTDRPEPPAATTQVQTQPQLEF